MATDLSVKIGGDLSEIRTALAWLRSEFARVGQAANRASGTGSLTKLEGSVTSAITQVRALVGAFVALQGVQVLGTLAKQGVEFNAEMEDARLGIASIIASMANLRDSQGKIAEGPEALNIALGLADEQMRQLRIAGLETAASTKELAEAFQQAVGPGLAAGLNLDQIRTLTIQITQAATALGVPANQLAQEIRSILDGSIDVNSRVAKTLGLSNEQVKNWQRQGTLVEELSKRMAGFSDAGKAAAGNFSVIVSNAKEAADALSGEVFRGFFEQLKRGISDSTAGLFDTKNLAVTPDLAEAVALAQELATTFGKGVGDTLRGIVELAKEFSAWLAENRSEVDNIIGSVGLVLDQFVELVKAAFSLAGGVADAGVKTGILAQVIQTVGVLVAGVRDGVRTIGAAIVGVGSLIVTVLLRPFELFFIMMAEGAAAIGKDGLASQLRGIASAIGGVGKGGRDLASDLVQPLLDGKGAVQSYAAELAKLQQRQAALANSNRADDRAELARLNARAAALKAQGTAAGLKNKPPPDKDAKAQLKAELEAREKLAKDAAKRELDILKEQFDDAKIATAAYYAERERIELAAIDREIAIERQKAAAGGVDRVKALAEIELLERQKNDVRRKARREQELDQKALDRQLTDAQIQLLEQQEQTASAAALRLFTQFKDLRARLLADGNTAGVELIDKLIDTGRSKAKFDEVKAQFDRTVEELRRRRQEIADQVQVGAITPAVGREQEDSAQQQAMQRLAATTKQLSDLAADPNALPAVKRAADEANEAFRRLQIEGLTGLDAAIVDLRAQIAQMDKDFARNATGAGVDALTGLFTDLVSGTKSAGEALRDFVRGFVQSMAQIAARALATFLVLQLLDAVYPGLGRATAATITATSRHTGGMAGHGPRREVPAWVFAGAPRYHDGGDVGIRPGEVPAILQVGERVQSRAEVAAEARGRPTERTTHVIAFGEDQLADAMASAAGERVVVHHVRNNRTKIDAG